MSLSHSLLEKLIVLFLVSYFVVGVYAHFYIINQEEVYLLYSWDLYTKVPPRIQTEFAILIHEFEGKRLENPIIFERARGVLYSSLTEYRHATYNKTSIQNIVRLLAPSILQDKTREIERLRMELEKTFLSHPVVYEVVEVTFNPIERWKNGRFININRLGIFTSQVF